MSAQDAWQKCVEDVLPVRYAMHRYPETGFDLDNTRRIVREKLESYGLTVEEFGGGLVAVVDGQNTGSTIGLRADMDALPIHEKLADDKTVVSQIDGKMHGCGHDGHTAILLGTAKYLQETKNFSGHVVLIFQAAEEIAQGANAMIEDGLFKKYPCEAVYGYHNFPEYPLGQFAISPGPVQAAVTNIKIVISGPGGHAGMVDMNCDTALDLACVLTTGFTDIGKEINKRNNGEHRTVVRMSMIEGAKTNNVIAEEVPLQGTIRAMTRDLQTEIKGRMKEFTDRTVSKFNAAYQRATGTADRFSAKISYPIETAPIVNSEKGSALMKDVAGRLFGEDAVVPFTQITAGEDFAFMMEEVGGDSSLIGFGQGGKAALHDPTYGFNDDNLPRMIKFCAKLVESRLPMNTPNNEFQNVIS